MGFSLVAASGGSSLVAVHGLLIAVASLVAEQGLWGVGFSSCGVRAQLPHGMWNLPRPGIKLWSPGLVDRFLTTGPLEWSHASTFKSVSVLTFYQPKRVTSQNPTPASERMWISHSNPSVKSGCNN